MFYVITGIDHPNSLEGRRASRPAHLARLSALKEEGRGGRVGEWGGGQGLAQQHRTRQGGDAVFRRRATPHPCAHPALFDRPGRLHESGRVTVEAGDQAGRELHHPVRPGIRAGQRRQQHKHSRYGGARATGASRLRDGAAQ